MPKAVKRGPRMTHSARISLGAWAYLAGAAKPASTSDMEWWVLTTQTGMDDMKATALWASVRQELMAWWTNTRPATRPHGWWMAEATEPLEQVGGKDVRYCFERGQDQWRTQRGLRVGIHWQSADQGSVSFEGMGTYLDRLQLWLPDERDRAPSTAWDVVTHPAVRVMQD